MQYWKIDFFRRLYFMLTTENNSFISSSNLDGSSQKVLISGLNWPNSLAVDGLNGRLYWTDISKQTVETCFIDGSDHRILLAYNRTLLLVWFYSKYLVYENGNLQTLEQITFYPSKSLIIFIMQEFFQ